MDNHEKNCVPFVLSARLMLCASFVRAGARVADIGTDHAYLPIYLACTGKIKGAVASDIKKEPLENGRLNILRYGVSDIVQTRLSNGLEMISADEADDIIIAGMGGELISSIIQSTAWLLDDSKQLILQPMSKAWKLREYLFSEGFEILNEECVISEKKVYSVLKCRYSGNKIKITDRKKYLGVIDPHCSEASKIYTQKILDMLTKEAQGKSMSGDIENSKRIFDTVTDIKEEIKWQQ